MVYFYVTNVLLVLLLVLTCTRITYFIYLYSYLLFDLKDTMVWWLRLIYIEQASKMFAFLNEDMSWVSIINY